MPDITAHTIYDTDAMAECAYDLTCRASTFTPSDDAQHIKERLRDISDNIQAARVRADCERRWLVAVSILRVIDGLSEYSCKGVADWSWERRCAMVNQGRKMLASLCADATA